MDTSIRPTLDNTFIEIAEVMAKRSTCEKIHVGCVIVKDKRIISTGYNGTPDGAKHCNEVMFSKFTKYLNSGRIYESYEEYKNSLDFKADHHDWSLENEQHAESNAIAYAAKSGISTNGATLYVTYSPCINCAKLIAQSGIKKVIYLNKYDRDEAGIRFLRDLNISCEMIQNYQGDH